MINVLVISGKRESVDGVMLKQFKTMEEAEYFVNGVNENAGDKYYQAASIIFPNKNYTVQGSCGEDSPAEIF